MKRQIAVYGATGHTARFVRRELKRRGLAAILIARDAGSEPAGEEVEWRGGAYAPGEIFDPKRFLGALSADLQIVQPAGAPEIL